jgi:hypothetical protein
MPLNNHHISYSMCIILYVIILIMTSVVSYMAMGQLLLPINRFFRQYHSTDAQNWYLRIYNQALYVINYT